MALPTPHMTNERRFRRDGQPAPAPGFGKRLARMASLSSLALLLTVPIGTFEDVQAQSRYGATAPHPSNPRMTSVYQPTMPLRTGPRAGSSRYGTNPAHTPSRFDSRVGAAQRPFAPQIPQFQQWVEWEPSYTLVPGDQLDIVVGSAPELSRTLTVGPDGRIVMPMSQPILAAGKTFTQVQAALMAELSKQLRDPRVAVTPRAYAPEQIFVGGEVAQPGTYTLPSRIGVIEAVFMAGGLSTTAKARQIAVLRRAPNGGMMMRTINLRGGLKNIHAYDDVVRLRRGDIIFVPQSTVGEVGQFVQNVRNTLPVDFNLSYQFGSGGGNGTTVITP